MSHRKEIIGDCTLYLGDCLEVMPTLGNVDAVVTDPPYKLTSGGCGQHESSMRGIFSPDQYDNGGEIVPCDIDWSDFMPLFHRVLADPGHAYVMANNRNVQALLNAAENAGFGFHNLLVWDKVTATPNRWYMKNCEYTGFFYKGKAFAIKDCSSKQLLRVAHADDSQHPTEKPVMLMRHYIENSTRTGQTILDPFMGSGTTGVACVKLGRKFIGIELDERYFDIACRRIEEAYKQPDFFISPPEKKPVQDDLL